MFIVFGSKSRAKKIGEGRFFCPKCRTEATYQHHRISRYFTLYFIPLFPISTLGEYVECTGCHAQFGPHVLQLTRAQIEERLSPWKCAFCNNTNAAGTDTCLACQTPRYPAISK